MKQEIKPLSRRSLVNWCDTARRVIQTLEKQYKKGLIDLGSELMKKQGVIEHPLGEVYKFSEYLTFSWLFGRVISTMVFVTVLLLFANAMSYISNNWSFKSLTYWDYISFFLAILIAVFVFSVTEYVTALKHEKRLVITKYINCIWRLGDECLYSDLDDATHSRPIDTGHKLKLHVYSSLELYKRKATLLMERLAFTVLFYENNISLHQSYASKLMDARVEFKEVYSLLGAFNLDLAESTPYYDAAKAAMAKAEGVGGEYVGYHFPKDLIAVLESKVPAAALA